MQIEKSVVIARNTAEVFQCLSQLSWLPQWAGNVVEVKITSPGPIGLGTTYLNVTKFEGRLVLHEHQVIEYEPATRLVFKSISGVQPSLHCFILESLPSRATLLTLRLDSQSDPSGTINPSIMIRLAAQQLKHDLWTLKVLLEAGVQCC